jgi:GTP-binding protein EngB required for normal cell division
MTKEKTSTKTDSTLAQRLGIWLKETRDIATKVGCMEAIEPVLQMLKKIGRDSINITIIGGPNSGKSSLINQLLQQKLLPVTALASNTQFCIQGNNDKEKEGFFLANDQVLHPLEQLHKNDLFPESSQISINIYLAHQWLNENGFHLIEKLPLDVSEEEIKDIANSLLEETDCVVLIIDALMPLKRAEVQFLSECVRRGVPVVLALSKIDKLLEEECDDVIAYISKHTESISPSLKVIPISVKSSDEGSIDNLRIAIQESLDETDILAVRTQQVTHTLLGVLDVIYSAAQTGLEVQQKNELERELELKQRQQQIDSQKLVWQQIEQKLDLKRHKVDDLLREHLQNNKTNLLELLLYELKRTNDVKTWWERDLPFRLERELRNLAGQLSKTINQQIISDLRWLQEEISRQFKYSLQALSDPNVSLDAAPVEQREITLSNSNTLKIFSRVGTAASVILAGTILTPLGLAGVGLAVSAIAALTAEQLIQWNTAQEREKIRSELSKVIERAGHKYALEVSRQLKESYNQVISDLKQHQLRWQQAQLQALIAIKRKPVSQARVNWKQLVQQVNQLMVEIKTEANL